MVSSSVRRAVARMVAAAGLCGAAPALAQTIYFADISVNPDSIRKINLDGSGLAPVLEVGTGLLSLDVDTVTNKIYYCMWLGSTIRRCNLDGSGDEEVTTGNLIEFPAVVRINRADNWVIWGDQTAGMIGGFPLGGGAQFIVTSTPFHRGLFVNAATSRMFWSYDLTSSEGNIRQANTNGLASSILIQGSGKPAALAVDAAGGKVYWTDYVQNVVRRANLDGSGLQTIYTDANAQDPRGIALDLVAGKVYWGQDYGEEPTLGQIVRTNLDGTGFEILQNGLGMVQDLVIVRGGAAPCYPNCDASTTAPVLNVQDFTCFLQKFSGGDAYANCDGSTQAPTLNVQDFTCFLQKFSAGCP